MINVDIVKKEDKIQQVTIQGHADFDEHGKDLVCAGVSAIGIGGLNALAKHYGYPCEQFEAEVEDGYIHLEIKDMNEDRIQVVLETLCVQLQSIEETYTKFIKINI